MSINHVLSFQELKILDLVANGFQNLAIAQRLCLSVHTIKKHKANLKQKLGIASNTQLYQQARALLEIYQGKNGGGGVMY
jgi:DNA-binding NarL/FixJ family response regulator